MVIAKFKIKNNSDLIRNLLGIIFSIILHSTLFIFLFLNAPKEISKPRPVEFDIVKIAQIPKEEKIKKEEPILDLTRVKNIPEQSKMRFHTSSKATVVKENIKAIVGVTEDSISEGGDFSVPIGNTLMGKPENTPPPKEIAYVPLFRVTQLPKFRNKIEPEYPELAKKAEIEGVVVLEVSIDIEGKVINANVVKNLGYGLDETALLAVRNSDFYPAMAGDQPVAVKIRIPYKFRIVE